MYRRPPGSQGLWGVIDHGLRLFRASFAQVFVLALIGSLLLELGALPMAAESGADVPAIAVIDWGALAIFWGAMAIGLALNAAVIVRMWGIVCASPRSMPFALFVGVRRLIPLLVASTLYGLAVLLGLLLLIVPGIVVLVSLWWVTYAVVLKGMGPIRGLRYSFTLTGDQWWHAAGSLVFVAAVGTAYYLMLQYAGLDVLWVTGEMPWYADFVVAPLLASVFSVFMEAVLVAMFYDLEARRAGSGADAVQSALP